MGRFKDIVRKEAIAVGLPYHYGSWARLNVDLDMFCAKANKPTALHIEHTQGAVGFNSGEYQQGLIQSEQVSLGIGQRIPLDYDSEKVGSLVDRLIHKGWELLSGINENDRVERLDNVTYQVLYDQLDANLVVVMFSFTLTDSQVFCGD